MTPASAKDHRAFAPDGVLVVDKPAGPTSHDVVASVRRLAGTKRVGHTGTLDPFATGVLPLVLGRATRLARFFSTDAKAYRATIALGTATTTDDVTGEPLNRGMTSALPPRQAIEQALTQFRGRFDQRPPAFSAKKVSGVRAYRLARGDAPVDLPSVPVEVSRLELEDIQGNRVLVSLECSAGFYVRALARDLGAVLGCGGHLVELRRTRSGDFDESRSVPLEALQGLQIRVPDALQPIDRLLERLPAAHLDERLAQRVQHGAAVREEDVDRWDIALEEPAGGAVENAGADESTVRLIGPGGRLLGIARSQLAGDAQGRVLQPLVVLV